MIKCRVPIPSFGIGSRRGTPTRPVDCRFGIASIATRAAEKEVRCYVNEEGHLVCDRLEPGDYIVRSADANEVSHSPVIEFQ